MGIKKATTDSFKSTVSDQWIDVFTMGKFDEQTAVLPGVKKDKDDNEFKGIISNGSRLYVPENTAAVIFDQSGVETIVTKPGAYYYDRGQESIFSWGTIKGSIADEVLERFRHEGITPGEKRISFINLREIRNIKFGTRTPVIYHDLFYETDLEIIGFGSFTIRIVDPFTFVRNYLPPNTDAYSFADVHAREQLVTEVLQDLITALGSLSKQYRISEIPAHITALSNYMAEDAQSVRTWEERFGLKLVKLTIESLELSEESKEIVKLYSANRMNVNAYEGISQETANIAAQQKMAQGVEKHGFGDTGGVILGLNAAQGLTSGKTSSIDIDEQVETIKKMKELLDEGILTQEEFNKKKKEILGL